MRGLRPVYKQFKTAIQTRENIPTFADFIPMLVVRKRILVKILHHGVKITLNRSSTQIDAEVEVVVQAKDVVMVVATNIKASSKIRQMMHKDQTHVDLELLEAGGVKELT